MFSFSTLIRTNYANFKSSIPPLSSCKDLWPLRQIPKQMIRQIALWKKDDPSGEEDDFQVGEKGNVFLVPKFESAFVGGDDPLIISVRVFAAVRYQLLFVPEYDGAYAGDTGPDIINLGLNYFRISRKSAVNQWTGTDYTQVPFEDINYLRQFIELGFSEKTTQGH